MTPKQWSIVCKFMYVVLRRLSGRVVIADFIDFEEKLITDILNAGKGIY